MHHHFALLSVHNSYNILNITKLTFFQFVDRRLAMMAAVAREIFPGITDRDYTPPKKKKGKKGKVTLSHESNILTLPSAEIILLEWSLTTNHK